MANFTDFNYQGEPTASDFIVGYKSDGSAEQRTTVQNLLSTGLGFNSIWTPSQGSTSISPDNSNTTSNFSFAQGSENDVTGFYSAALGFDNIVTGPIACAQGSANIAAGEVSSAMGAYNVAEGQASHATGRYNVASGIHSHAGGYRNLVGGYATNSATLGESTATGKYNIVAAPYGHAEGYSNKLGLPVYVDWFDVNPPRLGFGFTHTNLEEINIYGLNSTTLSANVRIFFISDDGQTTYSARISATSNTYDDPVNPGSPSPTIFLVDDETSLLPAGQFYGPVIYCVPASGFDVPTGSNQYGLGAHAEGVLNIAAGNYSHVEGYGNTSSGYAAHAEGKNSTADGAYSHAQNFNCYATGTASFAGGNKAYAFHDYSYAWNSDATNPSFLTTTASGQYCVNAPGGIVLSGGAVALNKLPTYKNLQNNLFIKNANYASVSANLISETDYNNSNASYASPGAFIIKGHSDSYNASMYNLKNISWPWSQGVYGLAIQNVNSMDPGTTFICDGRGMFAHAVTFRAGIDTFTGGSDHNHIQWTGSPSNPTAPWQMTNGGDNASYNSNYYTNRFMVHTLPQYQISTTITAVSGYFDTTVANYITSSYNISGVKLIISNNETNNYNLLGTGDVVGLTINPGLVGLVAVTYNSQIASISSNNANLSALTLNLYAGVPNLLNLANRGVTPISLKTRSDGGNPGVFKITSQIGSPATQYVGLTGNYKNVPKHILARFTTADVLSGLKSGSPLTLWIPEGMTSSVGSGFVTSSTQSSPTNFRYGYFDAFVKSVSGTDLIMSIGSLMDTYNYQHRTWTSTVAGNAGWVLYGGSQDTVHRPTFGTTGFYFEREPWVFTSSDNFAYLSGGMVKNACLGNSESYGNYSYGLGYRGTVLGDKSATLGGDMNYVYGNNSVAIGGSNLATTSGNQVVIGTYNDPNTNSLFVVGSGTSDTNRKNVFEVTGTGDTKQSRFNIKSVACIAGAGGTQGTATPITTDVVTVTGGANNSGVRLPETNGGHYIQIWNYAGPATTIYIYPNVGGIIRNQALAPNAPYTSFVGEGNYTYITSISSNTWILI